MQKVLQVQPVWPGSIRKESTSRNHHPTFGRMMTIFEGLKGQIVHIERESGA